MPSKQHPDLTSLGFAKERPDHPPVVQAHPIVEFDPSAGAKSRRSVMDPRQSLAAVPAGTVQVLLQPRKSRIASRPEQYDSASDLHSTMLPSKNCDTNPCEPGGSKIGPGQHSNLKSLRRPSGSGKHKGFRLKLKKETMAFENDYIDYTVEIPHRVSVRLEYLMGSNKVRLNDPRYMNKLHAALVVSEEQERAKIEHARQMVEQERVRLLVVNGEMPPPPDLQHLYNHPVFRVNTMLKRLEMHEKSLGAVPKPKTKISPCEPFEYNAGEYFRHLHKFGRSHWIPRWARMEKRAAFHAKVARARERLAAKIKKEQDAEEALKKIGGDAITLFTKKNKSRAAVDGDLEITDAGSTSSSSDGMGPDAEYRKRLKTQFGEKNHRPHHAVRFSTISLQQHEEFMETREKEIQAKIHERQKEVQEEYLEKRRLTKNARVAQRAMSVLHFHTRRDLVHPDHLLELHNRKELTGLFDEKDLDKVKTCYDLEARHIVGQYQPEVNAIVDHYIGGTKNVEELYYYAEEIGRLYARKKKVTEEFVKYFTRYLSTRTLEKDK